jgi:hypothetical protein
MMTTQPQIQMGYPDFWPVIFRKREKFFTALQEIGPVVDDLFSDGHREPLHKVCRHLAKMVSNSMNAVLLVGMNGFGNDALKIVRSMFESAVNIAYLRQHPDEFDDYFDFHFIVAMRRHRYLETYAPRLLDRIKPETIAENKIGFERVRPRYENKKGKIRSRWSKKDFATICAELGLQEHYLTFYDLTSRIMHADVSGMMSQGSKEPGVLDVEIAPSEMFVELALRSAHCWFILAVSEYVALARPQKQEVIEGLESDFVAAWKV